MSSPLSPATVSVLLQYIIPPSQLSEPIPRHLISTNLFKRHFFLGLTDPTTDTTSYLSWPSTDQSKIFDILEAFTTPPELHPSTFNVCYTGDVDSSFAHAEVPNADGTSGVRLVFEWDADEAAWKYHNVALMPFPSHSFENPGAISTPAIIVDEAPGHSNDDDDSYWDSYGNEGSTRSPGFQTHSNGDTSEDAYWAQYSSVHGTADSTRPTPPPERQRRPDHEQHEDDPNLHELNDFYRDPLNDKFTETTTNTHPDSEEIINIPYQSFNAKRPVDRNSPPCPDDLTERLRALQELESDPSSPNPPLTNGEIPEKQLTNGFTHENGHDSEPPSDPETESATVSGVNGLDDALRDAIRGTFKLWKLSQGKESDGVGTDKDLFLSAVKTAIIDY
ncbi:hypothetical protein V5O48_001657 [Marasmius crinis-equi]|uniref:Uncharacterized protein n=1 Tax=Marasmius crinis-equi TaxID=585013 RepID=A0ABR3FYI2_9AGAR